MARRGQMRWMVVGRLLLAVCILAVVAAQVSTAWADDERIILRVPYRSQFDGSFYEGANCGPATMGMIVEGFVGPVSTAEMRALSNKIQGSDAWDGVYIYNLAQMPRHYGLQVEGLYEGNGYHTWTAADIRDHIRKGHAVVPEVRYRYLPGHEGMTIWDDHYIVIFGLIGNNFVFHDPAFREDGEGSYRQITEAQLMNAMRRSEFPGAAFAVVPPPPPPTPTPTAVPTATATPSPTPVLSAPGFGEVMSAGSASNAAAAQLVPIGTPVVVPAGVVLVGEPVSSEDQASSTEPTRAQSSPVLKMTLALAGLLSLGTIGVAVSRRW